MKRLFPHEAVLLNKNMMQTIEYGGWPHCRRLSNGLIDLIVTADVGPRIIRFGFEGERNEFKEYADTLGKTGGEEWNIFGGHRLWCSPEERPRTYFPDNRPVEVRAGENGSAIFTPPLEAENGLQKEIEISLPENQARVEVRHRLTNQGEREIEIAAWALSVMVPGGTAILPLPPRASHENALLPNSMAALWAYTDMTDPRWTWGAKYILLHGDIARLSPQKIGLRVSEKWCAYARAGHLFVKVFPFDEAAIYPDFNSNVEVFTNGEMLELETLGPLTKLARGETIEHIEEWHLLRDVPFAPHENDVEMHVLPKIQELF